MQLVDPRAWVTNVTEDFPDREREDFFYRTVNGYLVKVKILGVPTEDHTGQAHGHVAKVEITGAVCGPDGKALVRPDGTVAKHLLGNTHHFCAAGDADELADLEDACLRCVSETVRAEKIHALANGYTEGFPKLVTRAEFLNRKLAEAATAEAPEADNAGV